MLLAIYLLAPSDFVQMCATPTSPPYLPCISPVSPYISLTTSSRCAPPLNPSPSHTLAIARTLTLVLTLTPTLALALTLALTLPLGR